MECPRSGRQFQSSLGVWSGKDRHVSETFHRQRAPSFFVERRDDLVTGCGCFENATGTNCKFLPYVVSCSRQAYVILLLAFNAVSYAGFIRRIWGIDVLADKAAITENEPPTSGISRYSQLPRSDFHCHTRGKSGSNQEDEKG